jgi:sugar phosphate isomerase/epimerase
LADIKRLSLNQATANNLTIREVVEGCVRHGIPSIALWRHEIAKTGLRESVRLVRNAGLHVSSVCRGGMFVANSAEERQKRIEDNFHAIDEAAELAADSLVLVVGASPSVPIADARTIVTDGLAAIVPYAKERGVKLGLEPLHPMYAGDRSVLSMIGQALEMAAPYAPDEVGLILDTFHIWWDPNVFEGIAKSRGRIFGFHVCDWLVPMPDMLLGRGLMGDGVIEFGPLREAVEQAGYSGPIEVEIFNQALWDSSGEEILSRVVERFTSLV